MSHPMHVLYSASFPSPKSFLRESRFSSLRGSDGCSGWNSVWMTNIDAPFFHSIQCSSSTVMVMMSSMKPSIDASAAVMYTARGYSFDIWLSECCLSFFGSEYMCGELRLSAYQDLSLSISLPGYIDDFLTVVYSASVGVVPKGNLRQIRDSFSTIAMQVDAVVAFAWIRR